MRHPGRSRPIPTARLRRGAAHWFPNGRVARDRHLHRWRQNSRFRGNFRFLNPHRQQLVHPLGDKPLEDVPNRAATIRFGSDRVRRRVAWRNCTSHAVKSECSEQREAQLPSSPTLLVSRTNRSDSSRCSRASSLSSERVERPTAQARCMGRMAPRWNIPIVATVVTCRMSSTAFRHAFTFQSGSGNSERTGPRIKARNGRKRKISDRPTAGKRTGVLEPKFATLPERPMEPEMVLRIHRQSNFVVKLRGLVVTCNLRVGKPN